jgi:HD-GYP domain-containing protein (c-di-GMP phosphodiesterase class II)
VACFPRDGESRDVLVACADTRLYESKGLGGTCRVDDGRDDEAVDDPGVADALAGLVRAVDRKDRYTRAHSEGVTRLALQLGAAIGLAPHELQVVRTAGLLHDVGKIGVGDRILKTPGPLSAEEMQAMQAHPALGDAIVAGLPLDGLEAIRGGVRHHHERWDGRGYPDALAGEAIPLLGRLLAIPDCYSAMTTDRPYRSALSREAALAEIERGAGTQFDPILAAAFLRLMGHRDGDADAERVA